MKSQTPIQLLVTTTAMPADVEILDIDITKDKMIYHIYLMESIVKLCLSMCRSFSKMWSRSQILMLRSIEDVTTQLSVPTTNDLISTILWKKIRWTFSDLLQRGTWKWATILFTRSPVFMSQQSSSCLTKGSIVLSNKLQKNCTDHLIPVTASLSSFDMMMLLLWLNLNRRFDPLQKWIISHFLVMFLTPFGSWKFWKRSSSMFQSLNPFRVVAQHHFSVLFEKK